jgi:hypothetical protein
MLIALFSFDEYGVSWDEPQSRNNGRITYNYIFENDTELLTYHDRDYGVAIELPLYILEKVFQLNDSRSVYIMRHLFTHLFFLIGAYFFFLLIREIYKNNLFASIAFLIFVLHPRIYAHSFVNSKDIPFMCMFIISVYFMIKSIDKPSISNLLKFSIVTALLINIRIMGLIVPCGYVCITIFDGIINKTNKKWFRSLLLVLSLMSIMLYLSWPYLWINPVENLLEAFKNMSKFRWDNWVVFNGDFMKVKDIGWSYIPTWFLLTIPSIHLFLAGLGVVSLIYTLFKKPKQFLMNTFERNHLIFFILFLTPVLTVILLKSVLYDSWRQLFFIYPFFIPSILYGIKQIKGINLFLYKMSIGITFLSIALLAGESITNFPNQNVYFNEFVSKKEPELVRNNFEQDYWGVSAKQAIEYVLKNDTNKQVLFCFTNKPGYNNVNIIKKKDRDRIKTVNQEKCTYFVTNFRWHRDDYSNLNQFKYYSIKRNNSTIVQVYKLK